MKIACGWIATLGFATILVASLVPRRAGLPVLLTGIALLYAGLFGAAASPE
jgi:hypothetical protein